MRGYGKSNPLFSNTISPFSFLGNRIPASGFIYVQFRSYGRLQPILCLASILYVLIPNVELLVRFADNFRCTGVLYNPGMGIPTTSVKHYSGCSACESAALYIYSVRQ